ncbi:GntR family transcriptional regulator [Microbacterium sp. M28]|uniref:GntR family transcriptional regulator n=1 Tax=Microbacterium sp. M28 TaxID=2962064 RepID=UPI0021F42EC2|nr:GntR family transcriptional regulator [Microbacterium sp. M28]UYO96517.1 GntR family transcriptional regulator [Microbacterium sp. M28]
MAGAGGAELESARVTRLLRNDIMLGRRAPGSRLIERDIAAELNVSRLPVREAIRALVGEGIVVARPRSWAVVREFSERDIQDFAEVREALETLIFEFAAARHDESGIARMRAALEQERAAVAEGDVLAARAAAGEFHETATTMADNDMLRELVAVFTTRLRWLFGQYENLAEMLADHEALFAAIEARDVPLVRDVLPRHLARGRDAAERRLREPSRSPD